MKRKKNSSTDDASPTKSSAESISLSIILILSSVVPSEIVNIKFSFQFGEVPCPARIHPQI